MILFFSLWASSQPPPPPIVWLCNHFFPTSIRNRSVFIQSHQWRVQQHRVHVLCDHTMVGRLYPRLVFVDCERGGENLLTLSVFRLMTVSTALHTRSKIVSVITRKRQISSEEAPLLSLSFFFNGETWCCHHAAPQWLMSQCFAADRRTNGSLRVKIVKNVLISAQLFIC